MRGSVDGCCQIGIVRSIPKRREFVKLLVVGIQEHYPIVEPFIELFLRQAFKLSQPTDALHRLFPIAEPEVVQ
jgi:hypothetical protein